MPEIVSKTVEAVEATKDPRWQGWSWIRDNLVYVALFVIGMWGPKDNKEVLMIVAVALANGAKAGHGHLKKKADEKEIEESGFLSVVKPKDSGNVTG